MLPSPGLVSMHHPKVATSTRLLPVEGSVATKRFMFGLSKKNSEMNQNGSLMFPVSRRTSRTRPGNSDAALALWQY